MGTLSWTEATLGIARVSGYRRMHDRTSPAWSTSETRGQNAPDTARSLSAASSTTYLRKRAV